MVEILAAGLVWTSLDTWIVVAGVLCALSCGLLGNFLVLRKMSMMGDAISHAVLPGLAIAFLWTGSRESLPMFIGAAAVGLMTAVFTEWIRHLGGVEEGASIGTVFSVLFALGLILIVRAADQVDLDPGCVLFGAVELVPLNVEQIWGMEVPRAVISLAIVLIANALFVLLFYKELKISAFDPALATAVGVNSRVMHYLLMMFVAITTVASFESVGSILVLAMLVVPGATAYLLTDRLPVMILLSLVVGFLSALFGHISAITVPAWFGFVDTNTAGMMAVVAGALFTLSLVFSPKYGLVVKKVQQMKLGLRIVREDILGLLWRLEETHAPEQGPTALRMLNQLTGVGTLTGRLALVTLQREGKVARDNSTYRLTTHGREEAKGLMRSHRLWESFISKHLNLPADHVHEPADRVEHFLTPSMEEDIARDLEQITKDPHGKPIPKKEDT
jgi:manganese/zinc/iron transport system permease protein